MQNIDLAYLFANESEVEIDSSFDTAFAILTFFVILNLNSIFFPKYWIIFLLISILFVSVYILKRVFLRKLLKTRRFQFLNLINNLFTKWVLTTFFFIILTMFLFPPTPDSFRIILLLFSFGPVMGMVFVTKFTLLGNARLYLSYAIYEIENGRPFKNYVNNAIKFIKRYFDEDKAIIDADVLRFTFAVISHLEVKQYLKKLLYEILKVTKGGDNSNLSRIIIEIDEKGRRKIGPGFAPKSMRYMIDNMLIKHDKLINLIFRILAVIVATIALILKII